MTVTLYYDVICGPSRMSLMIIRQLGIEDKINMKLISLWNKEHLTAEFQEINPSHCLPTLVDTELGITLWESRAINQYLVNKFAPNSTLYPNDVKTRALIDRHLYQDATSFFPGVASVFAPVYHRNVKPTQDVIEAAKTKLALLDKIIGSKKFAVGDTLTLADFSILVTVTYIGFLNELANIHVTDYSNLNNYFEGLKKEISFFDDVNKEPIERVKEKFKEKLAECQ